MDQPATREMLEVKLEEQFFAQKSFSLSLSLGNDAQATAAYKAKYRHLLLFQSIPRIVSVDFAQKDLSLTKPFIVIHEIRRNNRPGCIFVSTVCVLCNKTRIFWQRIYYYDLDCDTSSVHRSNSIGGAIVEFESPISIEKELSPHLIRWEIREYWFHLSSYGSLSFVSVGVKIEWNVTFSVLPFTLHIETRKKTSEDQLILANGWTKDHACFTIAQRSSYFSLY